MGAFRVLSPDMEMLDTGACYSEAEVGINIFPAPNEQGVYDNARFHQVIEYRKDANFFVKLFYLQVAPDAWAAGIRARYDGVEVSEPAEYSKAGKGFETVVMERLAPVLHDLSSLAAQKSDQKALLRNCKAAMIELLSKFPLSMQNNIINKVKLLAKAKNG